ncbi:MAG: histidine phosphatase family protein [Kiloniellales bacterium]|nr:histidine phosphatase family protein [Kiloniellales bacterium]
MILIRHGQSHFNLHFGATRVDPGIVDPTLTDLGAEQIRAAADQVRDQDVRVILASPYTRTLESADIIARELGVAVTVEPIVRERAFFTCDIGTPRSELNERWPHFDFGDLNEVWWPAEESEAELGVRCTRFREDMSAKEYWRHVLVVTHWGFIRGLTGQAVENAAVVSFDPVNGEVPVLSD